MPVARDRLSSPKPDMALGTEAMAEAQAAGSAIRGSISFDISSKGFAGWLAGADQGLAKLQVIAGQGDDGVQVQAPGKPVNDHGDGLDAGNMNVIGVKEVSACMGLKTGWPNGCSIDAGQDIGSDVDVDVPTARLAADMASVLAFHHVFAASVHARAKPSCRSSIHMGDTPRSWTVFGHSWPGDVP